MLELHQFRHSAFCLKVRMALQAKSIEYSAIEVTPGIGQVEVFRLSGQKQVPIIVNGNRVIADSTEIIRYLETQKPEPSLIPKDPIHAAQALIIEDWADTTFAKLTQTALLQAASINHDLQKALLPNGMPDLLKQAIESIPSGFINGLIELSPKKEYTELIKSLELIAKLLASSPWLVGKQMSIADIAIAAQLSLLKFPLSSDYPLAGQGVPGINDNPILMDLFRWRDKLDESLTANQNMKK